MNNLGEKILEKIKEEKITPKPRWQFLLKDYFIWLLFLVSLLLGSIAFCVLLHTLFTNDWYLYRYLHTSFAGHILISLPYIWIVFLILFVWVAYYNFKYTKSGYCRETYFVVIFSVIGSILLGSFLHSLGAGEKIESMVSESIPFYERITCCSNRKDVWVQPKIGLLAGEIENVMDIENFELRDFGGAIWRVREDEDTVEYAPVEIRRGERVKIIGEKEGDCSFWAREIRPWQRIDDLRKK